MTNHELTTFIHQLPKAELHVHLEGAISPGTVLELARRHNMMDTLPADDVSGLQKWFTFTDFDHFVGIYVTIQDLLRTPEDFALIAYRLGEDMARQNIRYREATFTPYTHVDYQDKGLTIEDVLDGLEQGRQQAKAAFDVEIRWVFDIYRNLSFMINEDGSYHPEPAEKTLAYATAGIDRGVVGFGIGGNEVGAPSSAFRESFQKAKQSGLMSVPHAGETMGPDSVWGAVLDLQADRIGHGVRSVEDPKLMDYLKEHHVTLEVNPTSNLRLHVYPEIAQHPFKQLDDYGILVTINSDDPPLFNTDQSQEYALIADAFGYGPQDLVRFARNAFLAAGAEPEVKQKLLADFDRESAALF
ncbi:adenosine deaminase [bacterium]|nr:adenosine deaminase [bacterium]MCB2179254.1 adenosine deaminase [bacterium]